jgi:hypothetical protein
LRCTDWERNRGQRSVVHPMEATTPTTMLAVRAMSATNPADRVKYQRAVELCAIDDSNENGVTLASVEGQHRRSLLDPRAIRRQ